jgi:putative hemolysin
MGQSREKSMQTNTAKKDIQHSKKKMTMANVERTIPQKQGGTAKKVRDYKIEVQYIILSK